MNVFKRNLHVISSNVSMVDLYGIDAFDRPTSISFTKHFPKSIVLFYVASNSTSYGGDYEK